MKKTKIIVPAMGLLVLGTAASVTGTVAWFSMNNSVNVTGMNVRTTVGSNILISATNSEASYASGLNQDVTGVLEPVSTVNGVNFFYHSTSANVAGDGHVSDTAFIEYAEGAAFDSNYGYNPTANADCFGYKDYAFYIKATNGEGTARTLAMSKCNLLYQGNAITDKAWRVALFAIDTEKGAADISVSSAAVIGNLKSILRPTSAEYFQIESTEKAVESTSSFGNLNAKIDDAADIDSVDPAATAYFRIVVRLWLEGNDTTCNNDTYAELNGDYRLDLSFRLVDTAAQTPEHGISAISSSPNAIATVSTSTAQVTLSDGSTGTIENGETAASFQWYDASDNTAVSGKTTYQYTGGTAGDSVYCLVTTARGNVYRTNTVKFTA